MQETWILSLGWKDPLEEGTKPTPAFLPRESHGRRSLVGYSPWGHKELDMTEGLIHTHRMGELEGTLHDGFTMRPDVI